jgi:transposase
MFKRRRGPFEYSEWKKARVNIDYHVEVDRHYYSVPYQFAREQVDIRLTSMTVEVLFKSRRVASHKRSYSPGNFVTLNAHMPKSKTPPIPRVQYIEDTQSQKFIPDELLLMDAEYPDAYSS